MTDNELCKLIADTWFKNGGTSGGFRDNGYKIIAEIDYLEYCKRREGENGPKTETTDD